MKSARRSDLTTDGEAAADSPFGDSGLDWLHEQGLLVELGEAVRGGKEATVYRATGKDGSTLAAKVYSDPEVGFRPGEVYLNGRYIPDRRIRKLLGSARRRGMDPLLAEWVYHEYRMLWRLHEGGIRGPLPAVGPEPRELVMAGRVVLMEWIGDDEPAPRLSDVNLEEGAAREAWSAAKALLLRLLELGLVHGDLSAYNILWWRDELVLIDVPQTVEIEHNRHAGELLERDVRSLVGSFRQFGIEESPELLNLEIRQAAGFPPSGPLERLH